MKSWKNFKDCINDNMCQIWSNTACPYLTEGGLCSVAQGSKEVPSIPSVKSSDVFYNLLSLSVRQKPSRISEKLGTSVFRWQPFFFLYFYFSFFRSFCSFFLLFSFLFLLCFFTLRPLLIFIVFRSVTYPEGGGCVFSPRHPSYIRDYTFW